MGEAKRRRRLAEQEWQLLFTDGSTTQVCLSTPEYRPESVRHLEHQLLRHIYEKCTDKSMLCLNLECNNEILTLPAVYAVLRGRADTVDVITLAACPQCATKSKTELIELIRSFAVQNGLHHKLPDGAVKVHIDMDLKMKVYKGFRGGIQVAIEAIDIGENPKLADLFMTLLDKDRLRLPSIWCGFGNCHIIVEYLRADFAALGIDKLFAYKVGTCAALRSQHDPQGLHSWIEADGWVIDASGGGYPGAAICIVTAETFYHAWQISDVRDVSDAELSNNKYASRSLRME